MEVLELINEILPYVLSIIATIAAFRKQKKVLTPEEIEAKAELKKQKLIAKLNKKNHIVSDFQSETTKTVETVVQDSTSGITAL